jgi:hypothetical protein
MKRIWFCGALVLALVLAPAGCKQKQKEAVHVEPTEEDTAPRLASSVAMNDPKQESQLLTGFYAIEANSWRWTAQNFSVNLRTPANAAQKGGTVDLELTVPEVAIQKLKSVTLSAKTGDTALLTKKYTQAGQYSFKADLPPAAFSRASTRIDFSLDKVMPPAGGDQRELGIIVSAVSLESK